MVLDNCRVHGNEKADRLAKEGGLFGYLDRPVSFGDEKTTVKILTEQKWRQQHSNYTSDNTTARAELVILFKLRTGHKRLNAHFFNELGIGKSEMPPCDLAQMTTEHLFQHCPLHDGPRSTAWPQVTLLRRKMDSDLVDLMRTSAFVKAGGVEV